MSVDAILARLEKKVMAEHLMPLALEIQAGARQNLSGEVLNVQTNTLREAVQVAITGPLEVQVGVVAAPNPENGAMASSYGAAWEFGWEDKPEKNVKGQPARPWMRPALDAVKAKRKL